MFGAAELGIVLLLVLAAGSLLFTALVAVVLWLAWSRVRRSGLSQRKPLVLRSATLSATRTSVEQGEQLSWATFTFPDAPPLELRVPPDVAALPLGTVGMLSSVGTHFEDFTDPAPPLPPGGPQV